MERLDPPPTFDAFCEMHDLEIVVRERRNSQLSRWARRWYAKVDRMEIKEGNFLASVKGEGDTPQEAIAELSQQLLGNRLVLNAYAGNRREFDAPDEWGRMEAHGS